MTENDPLLLGKQGRSSSRYSLGRVVVLSHTTLIVVLGVALVLASLGQQVLLPLYLSTFGAGGGPYFVMWFCAASFAGIFGVWSLLLTLCRTGNITPQMRAWRWHGWIATIGCLDTIGGILTVFASPLGRVSGPLQAVLGQTYLPMTIFISKFVLRKQYNVKQIAGALIVLLGAFVAMGPMLPQVSAVQPAETWWWPLLIVIGGIPQALMNILQEKMQRAFRAESQDQAAQPDEREFSAIYFQFLESVYQWIALTALFWTDFIPHFGITSNMDEFWNSFVYGWQCFVNSATGMPGSHCSANAPIATIFIACFVVSYAFGTIGTRHASANLLACISAVPPVLSVVFWYLFPAVTIWAGQSPPNWFAALYNGLSLAVILVGIFLFHRHTPHAESDHHVETGETVELLWPSLVGRRLI